MRTIKATDIRRAKIHKFEEAGFGPAPYRYLGTRRNWFTAFPGDPGKPGGSCDYCGTGIADEFWLESSSGRKFKVGCDCIAKAGDTGLTALVSADVREHQRKLRWAREDKKLSAARETISSARAVWPNVRTTFASEPHPNAYHASQGKTRADYIEWLLANQAPLNLLALARTIIHLADTRTE